MNRVLASQQFSLGNCVIEASPWTRPDNEQLMETLTDIARDREYYSQQLINAINASNGVVVSGAYPMAFMSLNDLAIDYLLTRLVVEQRQNFLDIGRCIAELPEGVTAWRLVSEVLGSERPHLEILEQFLEQRRPVSAISTSA